jgi:hypothetical protein
MAKQRTYRGMLVGFVVAVAVIAVAGFFAREAILAAQFDLVTYVDDSVGITPSSPVLLHGIAIGHVRRLTLSGSKDPSRAVRIDMRFNRTHLPQIPEDSTVAIVAANLLGDKSLDISRGVSPRVIVPGTELHSRPTQDIGSVLKRGAEPLKTVDSIMARVNRILKSVDESEGSAGLIVNDKGLPGRFQGIFAAAGDVRDRARSGNGIAFHYKELMAEAKKPEARFDKMSADFKALNAGTLASLMKETSDVSGEGKRLFADVAKDPRPAELMKQVKAVSDKGSALTTRLEARLNDPEFGKAMDAASAEYKSFLADFSKHPLHFVHFYLF